MLDIHTYKVAGHVFRLSLPDSEKLKDRLSIQYSPFEVEDDTDPLFSLEYCKTLPEGKRVCIYDEPVEDGETVVKLYRQDDSCWYVEMAPDHRLPTCATALMNDDFSQVKLCLLTRSLSDAVFSINNSAMLAFAFASADKGTLEMHASVIENGGKAYLFLGKSGTGKSTHSSLWLKYIEGSTLMNDDNPAVRIWPDGSIIAYGTPWSGKTPCYKNLSAPVGAFVQIRQCPDNKICRMSVLESYSSLFGSISGIKNDDSKMSDGLNSSMDAILRRIPCHLLDCRPDEDAARLCAQTVR